ncbi:unnamed protein product [Strongylus vulgaris]|uniref:Reverse transcriptase domain-containing protein n=1 Tax=Strongylus vulgaris TaxID=40348 RepID=A0A3P7IC15_STRVU|nr:unnamed protein product [Strongylus vulgaris]
MGFSCVDHIQTVSRIIEVRRKRLPLVLAFVDYEKAFDAVGLMPFCQRSLTKEWTHLTGDDVGGTEEVGQIGLQINRKKIQFMKNAFCEDNEMELEGSPTAETSSYIYLGRSMNMRSERKTKQEAKSSLRRIRAKGGHRPTDGPRAPSPPIRFVLLALCYTAESGLTL